MTYKNSIEATNNFYTLKKSKLSIRYYEIENKNHKDHTCTCHEDHWKSDFMRN